MTASVNALISLRRGKLPPIGRSADGHLVSMLTDNGYKLASVKHILPHHNKQRLY